MFNYRPSRRTLYVGGGILLVLLLIYIVFRCLPPSQEEVDKSAVAIRQEAYYTLEAMINPLHTLLIMSIRRLWVALSIRIRFIHAA